MNTNIVFESNIYPVVGRISEDKKFLSKISNYNRLRAIDESEFSNVPLSKLQRKIIEEQPTCSLNKADPCWGMIKTDTGYRWVSMCTKTECSGFSSCRKKIPFDPIRESAFIPMSDLPDEYGYKQFAAEYSPATVLIGDAIEYESIGGTKNKKKQDKVQEIESSLFNKLIREGSTLQEDTENQLGSNSDSAGSASEKNTGSETIENLVKEDPVIENPVMEDPLVSAVDIYSPSLNVFEYFSECSQERIINATSKDNFFVDAGPGTGKTYTLIQKLNHMVNDEGVEADGILVLCFTNAAVDEIKSRLRKFVKDGADRSLVNVDVRTFHSFAWWLINQANTVLTDNGWHSIPMQNLTYDMSLVKATEIVNKFGKDVVGNWEYFIVDEVQDLTNSLGYFVLEIVKACLDVNCGVTVLGDACQAIYDYNQETHGKTLKSSEFYKALFRKLFGKAQFVYLSENHRQKTELINLTSGLRTAILSADTAQMAQSVSEFVGAAEKISVTGPTLNNALLEKVRNGGSVSILFRNNGQTLKMSSDLRKRGIEHTLNITETKNNFAPWISDIFRNYKKNTISEDKFLDLFEDVTGINGDDTWYCLQGLLHTDNDVLNVRELLDAIALSKIDDSLLRTSKSQNVIVSNIHRSKGREYDCVMIDRSFVDSFSTESSVDEYKTLYVAVTRPKNNLLLASLQEKIEMRIIPIFATGRKRWGKTKKKKIAYFEFDGTKDINCDIFANISSELLDDIQIGDSVLLKRCLKNGKLRYSIIHEDTENIIGTLDEHSPYIQDFISYMKLDSETYVEMPSSVNDLYISGIYSQVVDTQYLELHPEIKAVTSNGVWKWIELVGIGHADYDVY